MFSSAAALSRTPDALAWTQGTPPLAPAPAAVPPLHRDDSTLEFRQLRHLTKNALQRLLCEVSRAGEIQHDWRQRRLLADLEHRLLLSARVSDALFGFTSQPAALARRLQSLAEATAELIGSADQTVQVSVQISGAPEAACIPTLLRIAHEIGAHASDPAGVVRRIMQTLQPGGIALLHEGRRGPAGEALNVQAVELLLGELATRGWRAILPPEEKLSS